MIEAARLAAGEYNETVGLRQVSSNDFFAAVTASASADPHPSLANSPRWDQQWGYVEEWLCNKAGGRVFGYSTGGTVFNQSVYFLKEKA